MTPHGASRRIHYAIAGEEWRIEAYKTLWRLAEKYGRWDETLERMEGYLLGYETDIDPFVDRDDGSPSVRPFVYVAPHQNARLMSKL